MLGRVPQQARDGEREFEAGRSAANAGFAGGSSRGLCGLSASGNEQCGCNLPIDA